MINIGILGFAHGHVHAIVKEWIAHPEWNVTPTCGWDHDEETAVKNCADYKLEKCESAEALLKKDIQAVFICAETAYHADLAVMAANAGKDIIMYKPIALNLEQANRICEAVEKNGVRFSIAWQMRTDPQNQKIRELIQTEELGKVCLYRRRHSLATHTWAGFENAWHVQSELNRDIFADDSSHPINMMVWIFGMPESVTCEMSSMLNPKIPNDNGVALFKYANGMIAEITLSFTCNATEITTEVYCANGSIQQYFGDAPATRLPRPEGMVGLKWYKEGDKDWTDSNIPSPAAHGARLSWEAEPLAKYLNGGETVCSAQEARDSLRCVLACYVSAREGRRVSINDPAIDQII